MVATAARSLVVAVEDLAMRQPFRISGHVFTSSPVVRVTISDSEFSGRGEASGVYYLGDDVTAMLAAIEAVRPQVEAGIDRATLQCVMPAGGARNAIDCALWELQARRTGRAVWELAGVPEPGPLLTTFTLGADAPTVMAEGARALPEARALKLKLTGDFAIDVARVWAVREARQECWIGVDANQGYEFADLARLESALLEAGVRLIEQPLRRGHEAQLQDYRSRIPLAADESALTLADVPGLVGRFDTVNIKLDKCGGLTEALEMARLARSLGLDVMVGNMVGSSLAMAPAFVLGQLCDVVDLDGPTFLVRDVTPGIEYRDGAAWCSDAVWGR